MHQESQKSQKSIGSSGGAGAAIHNTSLPINPGDMSDSYNSPGPL